MRRSGGVSKNLLMKKLKSKVYVSFLIRLYLLISTFRSSPIMICKVAVMISFVPCKVVATASVLPPGITPTRHLGLTNFLLAKNWLSELSLDIPDSIPDRLRKKIVKYVHSSE